MLVFCLGGRYNSMGMFDVTLFFFVLQKLPFDLANGLVDTGVHVVAGFGGYENPVVLGAGFYLYRRLAATIIIDDDIYPVDVVIITR